MSALRNVLIILAVLLIVFVIGILIYEFAYAKRKSPSSRGNGNGGGGSPFPPSPSSVQATTLNITNMSTNSVTSQAYFNYVDWNKNSKFFMVSGTNLYSKDNSTDSWAPATQIDYVTFDGTHWYMIMASPTTFHHYSQDDQYDNVASFANMTSPNGTHYKVSLV